MSATGNSSYAPKSPDLSSFYSAETSNTNFPVFGHSHPLQPRSYHAQAQAPELEGQHNFRQAQQPHFSHQAPYNNNSTTAAVSSSTVSNHHQPYQVPAQHHQPYPYNSNASNPPPSNSYTSAYYAQYQPGGQPAVHVPSPSSFNPSYNPSHTDPVSTSYLQPTYDTKPPHPHQFIHQQPIIFDQPIRPDPHGTMPPRKAAAQIVAKEPEIMPSPVRTKFPTARIKRIMQADEEVGKVAQQTPIAVGKALELFMVQLVEKSAEVAKEKHSKRITAPMLKQAIDSTNEWDFLRDIVAKVSEEKEKSGGRAKPESESDDEPDAGEVKKKGRGGRKKKAAAA
ncbi:hypothetical protein F5Y16DRAFT_363270 [Xylariaceae sp. FL0255]|nr:hypothetical protein F5Y16DRAFT_363270 [Xylariaceae sp. FL0255]